MNALYFVKKNKLINSMHLFTLFFILVFNINLESKEKPTFTYYCQKIEQEIQDRKHGLLACNVTYYIGGFHASWRLVEHETIGLTHPFHHDLRSRLSLIHI